MTDQHQPSLNEQPPFRPLRMIVVVLLILLTISLAAQWYSRSVALPRYCKDPVQTLTDVHRLLTEKRPAGDGDRKPYIIAARLTFLIPREAEEPLEGYLARLRQHLDRQCL